MYGKKERTERNRVMCLCDLLYGILIRNIEVFDNHLFITFYVLQGNKAQLHTDVEKLLRDEKG